MTYDLKSMTRKELEKLAGSIDKALDRIVAKEKKIALAAAEKAVKAHGFTLADITGTRVGPAKRKVVKMAKAPGKAKFANPEDATQTWTGKGRRPDWFVAAITAGKTSDDLAI